MAYGPGILDLEPHRVRGEVDAEQHAVILVELAVIDAVGDELADQQLCVVEDSWRNQPAEAVRGDHPRGAGSAGAGRKRDLGEPAELAVGRVAAAAARRPRCCKK